MNTKTFSRNLLIATTLVATTHGWAGPPLICHRIDIGAAKSLPWTSSSDWDGADPNYNVSGLGDDTLSLLAPGVPIQVRMETLRRAAIYATREARLAEELTARLLARTLDAEAAGKSNPLAWFDAGYFVETVRQATFVYRHNMLTPAERAAWTLRGDAPRLDGYAWVQKAIRLGGKDMEYALSLMTQYRSADLKSANDPTAYRSR